MLAETLLTGLLTAAAAIGFAAGALKVMGSSDPFFAGLTFPWEAKESPPHSRDRRRGAARGSCAEISPQTRREQAVLNDHVSQIVVKSAEQQRFATRDQLQRTTRHTR
ncbi:hypothetical protein J2S43_005575 [Catenuloplanes nepalensis]|uniref:Uncharacterized protein n=1 Tax=Catenuloplanes nepalensis TaxID=587533 RepID=A0ABT9N045_9ACTN|nr:hypothetical protein [Catenuloplanes nepalensis]